ncbi:hypothetical protein [Aquimarina pacifica]|uniref:hypothetical protein n=1 Tax=Aquimarina pacifica TaxID=1296415 RepID=UPI000470CC25|nr:hypothetical protein [Aquimarina pacifica]
MRYLKNVITLKILLLFTVIVNGQSKCSFTEVLNNFIQPDVKYTILKSDLNLTEALRNNETEFLGFIGENRKRLRIKFTTINKDSIDTNCYHIQGETTVMNKNLRKFNGEFNVEKHYVFSEFLEYTNPKIVKKQGFSVLNYTLSENEELTSTGKFKGKLMILWSQNKNGDILYDTTLDDYDSYNNYQFYGIWTSYTTKKSTLCCWGHYRIPCSGDLDWGASEFSPNEKYHKYGWADYEFPR